MLIQGEPNIGRLLLAHGAGAAMDSEFMDKIAAGLVAGGLQVIRFEFPYMQKRREDGKRRPPDRQPKLLEHYNHLLDELDPLAVPTFVAGKSMGGRMATMIVERADIASCFVYGYPFYATGKKDKPRTEHLTDLKTPVHIFQGTRDVMGNLETVTGYTLSDAVSLYWLEDGDHDLKPRKMSGLTQDEHIANAVESTLRICRRYS